MYTQAFVILCTCMQHITNIGINKGNICMSFHKHFHGNFRGKLLYGVDIRKKWCQISGVNLRTASLTTIRRFRNKDPYKFPSVFL